MDSHCICLHLITRLTYAGPMEASKNTPTTLRQHITMVKSAHQSDLLGILLHHKEILPLDDYWWGLHLRLAWRSNRRCVRRGFGRCIADRVWGLPEVYKRWYRFKPYSEQDKFVPQVLEGKNIQHCLGWSRQINWLMGNANR